MNDKKIDNFLPDTYEVPQKAGNYLKYQDGANRIRILTSPILGWEYWEEDNKGNRQPIRKRMDDDLVMSEVEDPQSVKHFWAMVVWNYQEKKIQILEITQKGIQKSLRALAKDQDWGSPKDYDIVITKTGQKLETEYQVQPKPAKPLDKEIQDAFAKTKINLEALFTGDDPFSKEDFKKEEVLKENVDPDDIPL